MKLPPVDDHVAVDGVAPHVGAWIETKTASDWAAEYLVAPHVGAWIETSQTRRFASSRSVAPHVGAWIETLSGRIRFLLALCRTPRGCVD